MDNNNKTDYNTTFTLLDGKSWLDIDQVKKLIIQETNNSAICEELSGESSLTYLEKKLISSDMFNKKNVSFNKFVTSKNKGYTFLTFTDSKSFGYAVLDSDCEGQKIVHLDYANVNLSEEFLNSSSKKIREDLPVQKNTINHNGSCGLGVAADVIDLINSDDILQELIRIKNLQIKSTRFVYFNNDETINTDDWSVNKKDRIIVLLNSNDKITTEINNSVYTPSSSKKNETNSNISDDKSNLNEEPYQSSIAINSASSSSNNLTVEKFDICKEINDEKLKTFNIGYQQSNAAQSDKDGLLKEFLNPEDYFGIGLKCSYKKSGKNAYELEILEEPQSNSLAGRINESNQELLGEKYFTTSNKIIINATDDLEFARKIAELRKGNFSNIESIKNTKDKVIFQKPSQQLIKNNLEQSCAQVFDSKSEVMFAFVNEKISETQEDDKNRIDNEYIKLGLPSNIPSSSSASLLDKTQTLDNRLS